MKAHKVRLGKPHAYVISKGSDFILQVVTNESNNGRDIHFGPSGKVVGYLIERYLFNPEQKFFFQYGTVDAKDLSKVTYFPKREIPTAEYIVYMWGKLSLVIQPFGLNN